MNREELLASILDNTATRDNYQELGILKFAKMFFPKRFSHDFAPIHYDMAMLLFRLLDPAKEYASERQAYMVVHRQAAKSTFGSFLMPTYEIYLKGMNIFVRREQLGYKDNPNQIVELPINEDYIIITSETTARAERFVTAIKSEIESRSDLEKIFGVKDPRILELDEVGRRKTNKIWRLNAFVTKDNTVVHGIGSGQRIRGANEGGSRPSLIIVDDMYSIYNTKTEETRQKVSYWFNAELSNSLDSHKGGTGKMLWLGTMIHPDTVVKEFKEAETWFGLQRPIISVDELHQSIDACKVNGVFKMPSKAKCEALQMNLTTLSWPTRADLYFILTEYSKSLKKRQLSIFYQEFMNEPIPPEDKMIERSAFYETPIKAYQSNGKQFVEFTYDNIFWTGECNLYLGLDPAASTATHSDDTAIVVAGIARCYPRIKGQDWDSSERSLPIGRLFPIILHIEGGKYSIHNYENMPGMCEALLKLDRMYKLTQIKIEANGQQIQIIREIRDKFRSEGRLQRIWEEYSQMKKSERISNVILALIQQTKVVICQPSHRIDTIYNQLLYCGISDHDDYADALAIALKEAREPAIRTDMLPRIEQFKYRKSRYDELIEIYGKDEAWKFL